MKAEKNAASKSFVKMTLEEILREVELDAEQELEACSPTALPKRRKVVARANKKRAALLVNNKEYEGYGYEERKYYNTLTDEEKMVVAKMEETIRGINKDDVPIRFKIMLSNFDENIKAIAIKKLSYLYNMNENSGEFYKTSNWIEALCRLPIGRYMSMPVSSASPVGDIRAFIKRARDKLDETVYGHAEAKDQIIRFIAQRISKSNAVGNNVIGLEGPPGVGKTLIAKAGISKALNLPFQFVSLSGMEDSSHMVGHSYTYEGSTWGKIADMLMKSECMNPIIFMDELDKVSGSHKGEEISNLLIHLTDSTQNDKFQDKYFMNVDFDLSKCLIIFSYNDASLINPILRDRMIKIKTDGYKLDDKVQIAQKYLMKDLCGQFNMPRENVVMSDEVIRYTINNKVEEEKGVRNLKRALELILSNINLNILLSEETVPVPYVITEEIVNLYVKRKDTSNDSFHTMFM